MMQLSVVSLLAMRTTIDIPDRDHAVLTSLAHSQGISLSKLIVELTRRGLERTHEVRESAATYAVDKRTGLAVFHSGRPITLEDVKALEEEW